MLELSQELLLRRRQEEKEARDLEGMVQSVEQNLHLMTVRPLMRKKITEEEAYYSHTGEICIFQQQYSGTGWRLYSLKRKKVKKVFSRLKRSKHEGNSANSQFLFCVCVMKQKRAVKAESSVSRLKTELQKLQVGRGSVCQTTWRG